ncbi:class I adenylate-forming enzyme family protein [Ureibacillus terrenus]|uniref:Long-chain fatty acid--CoA ligase n=1 Tax=Ureibacillus terrenus TaxID=118246 RepID=A0A540V6M4_9BACL|nr:long-chain fatty acid--CoA ligase [Ureibacillus terrenus]MED3661475.1 long-chain fatty acid--CoA ligase [Ureibacillus terrenus]MED3763942.1 long-chain fatty acid--CoA ligase [Ureibacillus terrenus]TQE91833.1 long-chain fatty acid--CoA ligase [Ureibacillus terrenus]
MFVTDIVEKHALKQPSKEAIIFENTTMTYGELYENAKKVAAYLQNKGYKKGDIIAQFMLNTDLFLPVYLGAKLAGLTIMPVNTKLAPPEVDYIFQHSEAKALFFDEEIEETIRQTVHRFEHVISSTEIKKILRGNNTDFNRVPNEGEETAVVMYTSGTTGKPKGVMLTHNNVIETAKIWSDSMKLTEKDRTYICTPLFHCAGLHVFAVPTLYKGGTVVIEEAFSPDRTLRNLVETEATIFFGVPAMYTILLNKPEIGEYNFQNLRLFCYGAAPMPYELVKRLKDAFPNVKVQNLYGQTENTPAASSLTDEHALHKIGSVGKPLKNTQIKLVGPNGEEVPVGEVGEICVKGPQVMKGYLKNPEETAKTIRDGWLYSGDLGKFDEEGFLYIVDRKKDMIIRGGENIYPVEVEEVLYQIPEILEAAVVGVPHEVYGEVPKAYIVFKKGKSLSAEEIINYCLTKLAKYKVPAEIEELDQLPRNASGKVLKHMLRPKKESV